MTHLKLKKIVGKIPTSIFELVVDERMVGIVQVRHNASAGVGVPKECASHIYYEVSEGERNKGYGKEALKLALEEAKKIGLLLVVVTCDTDNLASKYIIEVNGGTYTKSCVCDGGKVLLRYEFHLPG